MRGSSYLLPRQRSPPAAHANQTNPRGAAGRAPRSCATRRSWSRVAPSGPPAGSARRRPRAARHRWRGCPLSAIVAPIRSAIVRCAGRGIMWSSLATRYQLGLDRHAGSLIVPLGAATPQGTSASAMNAARSKATSAANEAANLARSSNSKPSCGGQDRRLRPIARGGCKSHTSSQRKVILGEPPARIGHFDHVRTTQPVHVGQVVAGLHRQEEAGRNLCSGPAPDGRDRRQPVEARVDLDRVEAPRSTRATPGGYSGPRHES